MNQLISESDKVEKESNILELKNDKNKVLTYSLDFSEVQNLDLNSYMPFVRYLIYHSQQNIAPSVLNYEPNLENIIEGQILAQRLGLVLFTQKKSGWTDQKITLTNQSDQERWVLSGEFETQYLKPFVSNELIFKLPAKSQVNLNIQFEKGLGSSHARFSKIQGYRYDPKLKLVQFELTDHIIDSTLDNLKKFLELELNES